MLPIPLLIAMVLAFGIDPPQTGVPPADVLGRVLETFGGITLVAALAFGLGFWVAFRVTRFGRLVQTGSYELGLGPMDHGR